MKKTLSWILFSLCLLGGQICLAQTSNQGAIVGTVSDPSDKVIPGATVTATNTETAISRTVTTDDRGNYRIDFLPPANYTIVAEAKGFKKAEISDAVVQVSVVQRFDVHLVIGEVSEQDGLIRHLLGDQY